MKTTVKYFQVLTEGVDQATNPVLASGPILLKNVSLDRLGVWATRKGMNIYGSKISANPGYGLMNYIDKDGNNELHAIADRDLFIYDEGTDSWGAAVDTDEWPATTEVNGLNFLNRMYYGSRDGATALAYGTGSTITDIVPTIGGHILAKNKNTLLVGGNSLKPQVGFYTDPFTDTFHSATGTAAANADVAGANTVTATSSIFTPDMIGGFLYNTTDSVINFITGYTSGTVITTDAATSGWDNDTLYVLSNNFKHDGTMTAAATYQENFVSFDNLNKMYVWDPTRNSGRGWSQDIDNAGCVSHRTLQVVNGNLIWANRSGVWLWGGAGKPIDISPRLNDRVDGLGYWNLIDGSNWTTLCAGVRESQGKYYLSVGTFQTVSGAPASAEANVILVFDTKTGNWYHFSLPDRIISFVNFTDTNGLEQLVGIGSTDAAIWPIETGTTDVDGDGATSTISASAITQHHKIFPNDPMYTERISEYYVKYTSLGTVTVSTSVDRGSYSSVVTLAAASSPKVVTIQPNTSTEGFTHSLKFAWSGAAKIEGYGFKATLSKTTRTPKK
jgi:hypothetical protein